MIRNNTYQNSAFFNSANFYAGQVLDFKSEIGDYFRLISINSTLAQENAALREKFYQKEHQFLTDSSHVAIDSLFQTSDSATFSPYKLRPARVIKNTFRHANNFITLNIGAEQGVKAGMGVIAPNGVVGRVKNVSRHYATVTSVLHSQMLFSAKIKKNNTFGTIKWDSDDFQYAQLHYIPLHVKPLVGDTIVTSGYNAVFPEGIMIGTISKFAKEQDKSFYTIQVKLSVDFSRLGYVYVVENLRKPELDSLEAKTGIQEDE
ncbi:MAG: rod shape-determining protein MreC [Hymenobacteraceae bacterium]|nr:rod shape-determining protein MreC [Hymenobacteraceae bacterium]MDX5396678.1 rod shape-determining protein MreC [Hymenobacteraceae bacterium]MDX5512741.1 rod shape-determining protein MreC [Hymenobacteraceae bacterium]